MPQHPTPTAIRIAENNPAHRPLPVKEPKAERGVPNPPAYFSTKARAVWHELAPLLLNLGTLSTADGVALEALCNQIVYLRMAQESIDKDGIILQSKYGPVKNPAVNIADITLKQIRSLLGEFGLTPAARTRIQSNNAEAESPFAILLAERKQIRSGL